MRSRLDDAEFWTNGGLGGAESVVRRDKSERWRWVNAPRIALAHVGEVSERAGASR
jgi:hypothetical protein